MSVCKILAGQRERLYRLCRSNTQKLCMQGRNILLNLGYAMESDKRWAGEAGEHAPRSFCPERWPDESGQKTGGWVPFGGGPRMCLGYLLATAELKVPPPPPLPEPLLAHAINLGQKRSDQN